MTRTPTILSLAALLAVSAVRAEAGPVRPLGQPAPNAAIRTRQAAMDGFNLRMGRLDALMGARTGAAGNARSRSAEAGR